jgi:hypothetical protein
VLRAPCGTHPRPPSLCLQDLEGVQGLVRALVSRTLLPRLEERMARLNASITATRKGLRNRLNRLWKGADERQAER